MQVAPLSNNSLEKPIVRATHKQQVSVFATHFMLNALSFAIILVFGFCLFCILFIVGSYLAAIIEEYFAWLAALYTTSSRCQPKTCDRHHEAVTKREDLWYARKAGRYSSHCLDHGASKRRGAPGNLAARPSL